MIGINFYDVRRPALYKNVNINVGRATLLRNFDVTLERDACETSSAKWNLGTNSAFALGRRKSMEKLDRVRPRSLTEVYFKNSVRTSQETHYVSATKPNRLMLFRETVAVYCENHTEHK
jgi:hypothetical protein